MRTEPKPFKVVLLQCAAGHQEVTVAPWYDTQGMGIVCNRCGELLRWVKDALIVPGRRHSEMPCYGQHVMELV